MVSAGPESSDAIPVKSSIEWYAVRSRWTGVIEMNLSATALMSPTPSKASTPRTSAAESTR